VYKESMADALVRAVKIIGSQSALARACKVTQAHVWYWLHKARHVPAEHVLTIERATDKAVTRHELRPDLYPNDDEKLDEERELAGGLRSRELTRE
jgi:DNA-binding transcriptional regulator YdaS (Cro superfamily)